MVDDSRLRRAVGIHPDLVSLIRVMRLAPMFASVAALYDHRRGLSPRPPREGGRPGLCTLQCGATRA
jgi:hypothetical protein